MDADMAINCWKRTYEHAGYFPCGSGEYFYVLVDGSQNKNKLVI